MNHRTPAAALFAFLLALAPLAAEDAASEEDLFGQEEEVTQPSEQTQNAAPRDEILTSAVPWLTGSFTGIVGIDWSWSDLWGGGADFLNPTSYGLSQSATAARLGFVARLAQAYLAPLGVLLTVLGYGAFRRKAAGPPPKGRSSTVR